MSKQSKQELYRGDVVWRMAVAEGAAAERAAIVAWLRSENAPTCDSGCTWAISQEAIDLIESGTHHTA